MPLAISADRVEIPRLMALARHAGPHLIEATVIPLGLFYGGLWLLGLWGALIVGLAWSYVAIGRRLITRQRVPGLLLLGAFGITARTIVAFATGSVFVYFLQPTLTTLVVAGAFLVSLPTRRPLAERLAADFCPLPKLFLAQPGVRTFFLRITVLWSFVQLANAAITITLLLSQPIGTFVWVRSVSSMTLTVGAVVLSTMWFKHSMHRHGIAVVWARAR
ncbi:MAG: VC0807 family protein [Acidimicrobiales bacterium]